MGFKLVLMSGSGSSVFALTTNHKLAFLKYRELEKKGYKIEESHDGFGYLDSITVHWD